LRIVGARPDLRPRLIERNMECIIHRLITSRGRLITSRGRLITSRACSWADHA
jgi:hypothetical protein